MPEGDAEKKLWSIKEFPSDLRRKVTGTAMIENKTVAEKLSEIIQDYFIREEQKKLAELKQKLNNPN